jgi:putative ABC transport system permease protein
MISNFIKVALRNLIRYKAYSLLILFGFALGLAIFILSLLHTGFNFSYDTFHEDSKNIYGVVQVLPSGNKGEQHTAITPAPLLPALSAEFSEIEYATRFSRCPKMIVRTKEKAFYETGMLLADENFLSFFNFNLIRGEQPENVLSQPAAILLSEDSALKYFGSTDPIGKILTLDNRIDVTVTGIIQNNPLNSSIKYDFLLSMSTARLLYGWMDDWSTDSQMAFVRLSKNANPIQLQDKFPAFIQKNFATSPEAPQRMYLFPFLDFRKHAEDLDMLSFLLWGEPFVVSYFLIGMALGLLLIVCINFMNLSTARYLQRTREIGVRKVVGAKRLDLIKQFIGESIIIVLLSVPLAVVIYEVIRPLYLSYVGLEMDISLWNYPGLVFILLGGTVLLGIFSGSYPAFFLSTFHPVQVLNVSRRIGKKGVGLRKILVVSQFFLSILLIIFTIAISHQLKYLMTVNFGFDRSGIAVLPIPDEVRLQLESLKTELSRHPDISSVSAASRIPISWMPENPVVPEGYDETEAWTMNTYGVDYDFIELLNMEITVGRSFSRDFHDHSNFVLNETAARQLKWEDPLDKRMRFGDRSGMVIGVAKDYLFNNAHWKIGPSVMYLEEENLNYVFLKISTGKIQPVMENIGMVWAAFAPGIPFEYSTLDGQFEAANIYIEKMYMIIGVLGIIAIFISCLGLVALASHIFGRRRKEIGVRKILGASVPGIVTMFMKHFIGLIVVANVVAWPLTYILLKTFLKWGWAYTTDISLASFILAAILSLLTAVFSVVFQAFKVARANPVSALKYE